jgi:NAD(P)-dependent dehydrogenase (short-subunit alcohol dehydrogenase family)
LVNAAGLTTRGGYGDATVEMWNRMFSVNTRAPFFLMDGAIADMKARNAPGSIVNILSMNAHCGTPELAVYSATKGALLTLTKNAANAHLAARIRVNGINLGWTDTETERHLHAVTLGRGAGWLDAQAAATPLGRLITAEDCARQAVWMLSPASAPMTGVCLDLEQAVTGAPG